MAAREASLSAETPVPRCERCSASGTSLPGRRREGRAPVRWWPGFSAHIRLRPRAGVTGYVLKPRATSELVHALRAVCRGEMYLTQSISRTVVQAFLLKDSLPERPLSDRERQVLQLVAEGKTTKEIASLLGRSEEQ